MYWADEPAEVTAEQRALTWAKVKTPVPNGSASGGASNGKGGFAYKYTRLPTKPKHVDMLMYVMKHYPGNTNNSWTRQFFGDLAHGTGL
jgi:hypothetical protein